MKKIKFTKKTIKEISKAIIIVVSTTSIIFGSILIYMGIKIFFNIFRILSDNLSLLEYITDMPVSQRLWFWIATIYVMCYFVGVCINFGTKWIKWSLDNFTKIKKPTRT